LKSIWMRFTSKNVSDESLDEKDEVVESTSQIKTLPDEMLVEIFKNLDRKGLYNARSVSSRWNGVVLRNLRYSQRELVNVSRLTITYIEESKSYKLSWCKYTTGENRCHELFVAMEDLERSAYSLGFCFAQLDIQRLFIESMPKNAFNDKFVKFLCDQFKQCVDFKPSQLSIKNVDLSKLSSDGLKRLLTTCAKRLEILEFFGIGNVASDLITDEHLSILETNRVRRLSIQFKDSDDNTKFDNLQVGDESLQAFLRLQVFPTFSMGHCLVTSMAVCEYVKEWLTIADTGDSMKCHSITLTDCPHVSNERLVEELQRQGLDVIRRLDENVNKFPFDMADKGSLVNYTVKMNKPQQEFIINLFTTTH